MKVVLLQVDKAVNAVRTDLSTYNLSEPLGLLAIDAFLRRAGHDVTLLCPGTDVDGTAFSEKTAAVKIIAAAPHVIGVSAMTNQIPASRRVVEQVKRRLPNARVILGGDHISGYPEDLLAFDEFDFAVSGEGELAVEWLVRNFATVAHSADVPEGVYWKEGSELRGRGRTRRISHIDSLPPVTRRTSLIKGSRVGQIMWPPRESQTGMVSTYCSRGCPYSCSYCDARQVWGKGVEWRKPAAIVHELRNAKEVHGANTAFFVDLTFNSDRNKLMAVCAALEEAKLGIYWYVLLRPGNPNDRISIDWEMLNSLKRAGCSKIGFGVETLSASVGRDLGRKLVNDYLKRIVSWMDELGLLSKVFLIIGHPSETKSYYDMVQTFLSELGPDEVRISFLTPFPGTPLWRSYIHKGILLEENYEKYTTFAPILPHPQFSARWLEQKRFDILSQYYFSRGYRSRMNRKVDRFPNLAASYTEFFAYLKANGLQAAKVNLGVAPGHHVLVRRDEPAAAAEI